MKDRSCIQFLQNILPRLSLRWSGYRKVSSQVCKRISRRIQELHLADISDYRCYLVEHPCELELLKEFCQITISRFYRDRQAFQFLEHRVLPELADRATQRGKKFLRCWSAGCASGEEPYTLSLLWDLKLKHHYPGLDLGVLATDANRDVLLRARKACYSASSIKELPEDLRKKGFNLEGGNYCLRAEHRHSITFRRQDIRESLPEDLVDLLLCRNLVFTYFEESLQSQVLECLEKKLAPGGFLVIGAHEKLPSGARFSEIAPCIFQKSQR